MAASVPIQPPDDRSLSLVVLTLLYEKRRLSDDRLADVLVAAGFDLPRPTA